jgi:ribosomal protein S18
MNKIIIDVSKDYNINPRALKRYIKEVGFKPKKVTRFELIATLTIYAPNLFYCRESEQFETVEYLDFNLIRKLIKEYKKLKDEFINNGGVL